VEARVRETIGRVFLQFRDLEPAARHAQAAVDLFRQALGEANDRHSINTLLLLAWIKLRQQRYEESEKLHVEALGRSRRALGEDHTLTWDALGHYGHCLTLVGNYAESEAVLLRCLDRRLQDGESADAQMIRNNLGVLYHRQRRLVDAETVYLKALAENRRLQGDASINTLILLGNLADLYRTTGRAAEAEQTMKERLAGERKSFGDSRPSELFGIQSALGGPYVDRGRFEEAIRLLELLRDDIVKKLGPDNSTTLSVLYNLAGAYKGAGKLPEAIRLFEQVRDARVRKYGLDDPRTLKVLESLLVCHWRARQFDKSIPLCQDVLQRWEAKCGRDHLDTLRAVANLGVNYRDAGRLDDAIPLLEEAYRKGRSHPTLTWVGDSLRATYVKAGKAPEAVRLIEEQVAAARQRLQPESSQLGGARAGFGSDLLELKQYAAAEPLLRECLALREKLAQRQQAAPWQVANAKSLLGGALLGRKEYAAAEPLLVEGHKRLKQDEKAMPAQAKFNIAAALGRLIELLDDTDREDEAANLRKELEALRTPANKPGP
jgi:tetratricopeptide (TPR) repeat protein